MASIIMRCPESTRVVPVGVTTDPSSFQTLPCRLAKMRCPACNRVHWWSKNSTWLAGDL